MASHKTAHRRRRVHSSKRRKNVKSRKVMRGGRMEMSKCKAFVGNPKNYERVELEKRDYGIKGIGLLACNEFVNTDVDFFGPYKPKSGQNLYPKNKPTSPKPNRDVVIDWGDQ